MDAKYILDASRAAGHTIFENGSKDYNLNLIGVRSGSPKMDEFGCELWAIWRRGGGWESVRWTVTTLPGSYYMQARLLNPEGCAILAPGQYRGAYKVGLHRGSYRALCQLGGPVRVFRDGDRDREFDLDPAMMRSGRYGINIHQPGADGVVPLVGANSAGCQVFEERRCFREFMYICGRAKALWGNSFSYTLLDGTRAGRIAA